MAKRARTALAFIGRWEATNPTSTHPNPSHLIYTLGWRCTVKCIVAAPSLPACSSCSSSNESSRGTGQHSAAVQQEGGSVKSENCTTSWSHTGQQGLCKRKQAGGGLPGTHSGSVDSQVWHPAVRGVRFPWESFLSSVFLCPCLDRLFFL